jgi:hypothetical protein
MGSWTVPGLVHHGLAADGRPELTGAWPPAPQVINGANQGVKDGEMRSGNSMGHRPKDWRRPGECERRR